MNIMQYALLLLFSVFLFFPAQVFADKHPQNRWEIMHSSSLRLHSTPFVRPTEPPLTLPKRVISKRILKPGRQARFRLAYTKRSLSDADRLWLGLATPEELGMEGPGWISVDRDTVGHQRRFHILERFLHIQLSNSGSEAERLQQKMRLLAFGSVGSSLEETLLFCAPQVITAFEEELCAEEKSIKDRLEVARARRNTSWSRAHGNSSGSDRGTVVRRHPRGSRADVAHGFTKSRS